MMISAYIRLVHRVVAMDDDKCIYKVSSQVVAMDDDKWLLWMMISAYIS